MKKWLIIIASILLLALFVAIFGGGIYLKQPLTENDDVISQIKKVEQEVEKQDWDMANKELEEGITAWNKIKNRIQFSVERTFIDDIDNEMATMKGAIKAKDDNMLIISVERVKFLWKILGK